VSDNSKLNISQTTVVDIIGKNETNRCHRMLVMSSHQHANIIC